MVEESLKCWCFIVVTVLSLIIQFAEHASTQESRAAVWLHVTFDLISYAQKCFKVLFSLVSLTLLCLYNNFHSVPESWVEKLEKSTNAHNTELKA